MWSISAAGLENNTLTAETEFDAYEDTIMARETDGNIHPQDHADAGATSSVGGFLEGTGFFHNHESGFSGAIYRHDVLCDSWPLDDLVCDGSLIDFASSENYAFDDKHAILAWACGALSASPSCRRMLGEAVDAGWSLALETLGGPDFHLDVPQKLLVLDNNGLLISALGRSEYFRNALIVSLTRALRDIWQEKRHGAFDEVYGPEAVLYLERTRSADLDVLAILVAWELRGEGLNGHGPSLWRHMIGSQEGDIAMRFSGTLERDPASAYNGKALQAAFVQWFREPARVDACDHDTLNMLDAVLQDCAQPDPFGQKKLTPVGVEILSCLPDKTAYLQGFGDEILRSPNYAGLGDMVNQAHLLQILHDMKAVRVQHVPFRSAALAAKIFPNGEMTVDE